MAITTASSFMIAICFCIFLLSSNGQTSSESQQNIFPEEFLAERNKSVFVRPISLEREAIRNPFDRLLVYRSYADEYYGMQAKFTVWGLPIGSDQLTMSLIYISNGDNIIQVGWHICPALYGDYDTHFFVSWTTDNFYKTGCYNMLCPGFVLSKNATSIPGAKLWPLSAYGGTQNYANYKLFKDSKTGDWWVYEGANAYENPVGYFSKSLFTSLAQNASHILLGGFARATQIDRTPPIGSGHYASDKYGKAADFEDIRVVAKGGFSRPGFIFEFRLVDSQVGCYSATRMKFTRGQSSFYYGGPGGC